MLIANSSSGHVSHDVDPGLDCPSYIRVVQFNLGQCARGRRTQIVQSLELLHYQVAKIGHGRGAIVGPVEVVAGRKFENREKS
jgi:hypothetical protein